MIEHDARLLAERLALDFPDPKPPPDAIWRTTPAARVIDCVLSLRRPYDTVVVPRVKRFTDRFPDVSTCEHLATLIRSYPSPAAFHADALRMNSPAKALALVGVLDYLIDIQHRFEGDDQLARLGYWARWARPGDYLTLGVKGFKLAGFQYLRMLFGAETTKPDTHILKYAERVLGRPILGDASAEVRAVYAIERAGEILSTSVRRLDVAIWEAGSGRTLPV